MHKITKSFVVAILAVGLVGCAGQGGRQKQNIGTAAGGVAGGILGASVFHGDSKVVGAIGGAILGAMAGGAIGHSMDQQDKINTEQAMIRTRVGQEATWTNQKSGANYTVQPVREYTASGEKCRYAKTTVLIDGKTDVAYSTVCRKPGGPWYVKQ